MGNPYRTMPVRDDRPKWTTRAWMALVQWFWTFLRWVLRFSAVFAALGIVGGAGYGIYRYIKTVQRAAAIERRRDAEQQRVRIRLAAEQARIRRLTAPVTRFARVSRIEWSCVEDWHPIMVNALGQSAADLSRSWHHAETRGTAPQPECSAAPTFRNIELAHRYTVTYKMFYALASNGGVPREIEGRRVYPWPPVQGLVGSCWRIVLNHDQTRVLPSLAVQTLKGRPYDDATEWPAASQSCD